MATLDTVSIGILLAAIVVLAGILSSVVAMRFGAPLLVVFLLLGMLAGEAGPLGIQFDDVKTTYIVGSVALALILFDGGLHTKFSTFRSVLAPATTLATVGVVITAALTAPATHYLFGLDWVASLLVGAVVASTDAAAVFFLLHARGLRLRPRVAATLEVESGTNDPFAVFMTLLLVQYLMLGDLPLQTVLARLATEIALGSLVGMLGGRAIVIVLNLVGLSQGLHAPFVMTSALVIYSVAASLHGSGFLAVYLAGLAVGNRPTRAHRSIVSFLDAVTWMAQIVMFVLLGLLVSPARIIDSLLPSLGVAAVLMLIARPAAVMICLTPFGFYWREKVFISWVGLRGAVGIFLASIPLLVGLPRASLFFDIAFVVVLVSLLIQGWTLGVAARWLHIAFSRFDPILRRVELDLPGQLAQELVGYRVGAKSPYMRRGILPSWAKLMLVIRNETVLVANDAGGVKEGDHAYFLAPLEKAPALDRFLVDMPPPAAPDPRLLGDFFVAGDTPLGALAEIYGVEIADVDVATTLAEFFKQRLGRAARKDDLVPLGTIALLASKVSEGVLVTVGLRLAEPEPQDLPPPPKGWQAKMRTWLKRGWIELVRQR
jgi:cell volume regulation protein A